MILDGGMGHLLRRNGVEISGPIGTMERFLGVALANRDAPELVLRSHLEFIDAGADVITTNTYACVPAAVNVTGEDAALVTDLIRAGGQIAQAAREASGRGSDVVIAGCLPPLHETYRADRVGPYEELARTYREIVRAVAPYSDVLLCETMHSSAEAYAAVEAADAAGLPIWVSFTLAEDDTGRLRSHEEIEEAVASISGFANVQAVLVNCSTTQAIDLAIPKLRALAPDLLIGAYANGFSDEFLASVDGSNGERALAEYDDSLTPQAYAACAQSWQVAGADIIGGCCGVFPEHLEAVATSLDGAR